jgi:hypothetical protein
MKFCVIFPKSVEKTHVSLTFDKNNVTVLYMKACLRLWHFLAKFFFKWETFKTQFSEQIKTHFTSIPTLRFAICGSRDLFNVHFVGHNWRHQNAKTSILCYRRAQENSSGVRTFFKIPINRSSGSLPNNIAGKVLRVHNYTLYQEDVNGQWRYSSMHS